MTHMHRDRRWPVFDLILIGATIAMVCLAATAFSQEPPTPTPIVVPPGPAMLPKIDGLSTVAPGTELRLVVSNLKLPAFADLEGWSTRVRIAVDSPDGAKPVFVDSDVAFALTAQSLRLRITFAAESPGIYVIILHDGNAGVVAYKRVTVGAGVPTVNPPPGPGPNPNQPGPLSPSAVRKVVLIYEKDQSQISPQLRQAIHNLNVGSSGVVASIFEVDTTNGGGSIPKQFEAAVKAAKDAGIPALVSLGANDVVLRTVRNPTTEAHLKEVLGQ